MPINQGLEITPQNLDRVILWLKQREYQFLSLDQMCLALESGNFPRRRFAVFTLDDGYADNYFEAYPVFKRHSVPFTLYVTNSFVNRTAVLWWYHLEQFVLMADQISLPSVYHKSAFNCRSIVEKQIAFSALYDYLMVCKESEFEATIKEIAHRLRGCDLSEELLSWKQVRELATDELVTIGCHTVNHKHLSQLATAAATSEMIESRSELISQVNCRVDHFAYPYGGRSSAGPREFELAKACGFKSATTTRSANIFKAHRDYMMCLPRVGLNNELVKGGIRHLDLWLDGVVPCYESRFSRVITA